MDKLPKDFTSTKDTYYAALSHGKIVSTVEKYTFVHVLL